VTTTADRERQWNLREIPDDIRAAVEADVNEKGTNRTAVVVSILANALGVRYEPSTRPTPSGDSPVWNLILPPKLHQKLYDQAYRKRLSMNALALSFLARHYDLPYEPPRRGRPAAA
jgi:hypothetical protein